ncbi:DUF5691 domain-containing protein [Streptomyces sp. NBC_01498]|uniref:DUF5691 domain-containing protein n=1 Tax=Streptomyces sp. NBC_01498 TaxID=2975870 RepID=UPI002E7BDD3F|nr:DUF5691 domain-containing protein [Streptomyces sp. NBC_01498]WTL25076.1 DUF5691 domain-containing protein [Streptomyces sp. NBC_01498]
MTGTTLPGGLPGGASTGSAAWEELVTSALLGTDRRPPPADVMAPGRDAPAALLDAAAVHTLRRRAGLLPARAAARPDPAPSDDRRELPEPAGRRLTQLLADRSAPAGTGGRRGTAPDLTELLPQWLTAANDHGYRAPAAALPALLDAARGRNDLRPHALAFAGPRGLWLARFNPDWKFALRGASGGAVLPGVQDTEAVRQLWEEGLFAERVALLAAVRARDAGAARALLATTWSTERAEDRLMFLDSLRAGLSAPDEPFLEDALSDRSRNVRATAAELLSALPDSALAARMAARAATCVSLDLGGGPAGPTVVVEAPHECDAAMQRDGVSPTPPSGRGERSWWLGQLVEATPLSVWSGRLGDRTPEEIVALPVLDDWTDELHAAWCRAAVRQRDAHWARALLGPPATPPATGPGASSLAERAKLLATLPPTERADWVAGFIAAHGLSEAFQLLGVCAVPWSRPLGRAVVDALDIARDGGSYPWSFSGVMGLAERCLDPSEASQLDSLTATPDESEGASPGAGGYWSEAFQRLVSTLRLRAAMTAELTGLTEAPPDGGPHGGPASAGGPAGLLPPPTADPQVAAEERLFVGDAQRPAGPHPGPTTPTGPAGPTGPPGPPDRLDDRAGT